MNGLVLVVDDNAEIRELQSMALEAEGFSVVTAASGESALEMLDEMPKPQLVLLDVDLGNEMSGPEFLELAERKYPRFADEVPVVFMTACSPPENTRAAGCIDKMADFDSYLSQVKAFASSYKDEASRGTHLH